MEVLHRRCAGIDISKRDAKVCVRVQGGRGVGTRETVTTFGALTKDVLALRDYLQRQRVTCVVMEATSDYWKPFHYLLEDAGFELVLANPHAVRSLPGRKTDVADAAWLAQLGAHGLVRGSFVPPAPIRELRDLTRTRASIIAERAREIARLEKLLEDAGIKLSSVVSDLTGVSARAMVAAMIAGERDPQVLADLARTRLRGKIDVLVDALTGRFTDHHAFLAGVHLHRIDEATAAADQITARIEELIEPFRHVRDLLTTIPGVGHTVADVIVAETGADMTRFPTPGHLVAWAGLAPGRNESAGRTKPARTRPGSPHLRAALGTAAMSAARTSTYLGARYRRITARRGPLRANVALQHTILADAWHMLTNDVEYHDLGPDYFTRRRPDRAIARALHQLQAAGYTVHLERAA
jgi:transposase